MNYAQLLTEANSDVPGPILAQIVSGPFDRCACGRPVSGLGRLGRLSRAAFNLISFKGMDYPVNAVALDPDTALGGMATDVDQRYFTRVVLPAAAGFLQGFGSALGSGGSSITTNGTTTIVSQSNKGITQGAYQGLGQAGNTAAEFFQNQANLVKPLVRVAAGTPIGMFFVSSVTEPQNVGNNGTGFGGQQAPASGYYPAGYGGQPGYGQQQGQDYGMGQGQGYGQSTYGAASGLPYPSATVSGYGQQATYGNGSVPYPNYAGAPANSQGYTNSMGMPNVNGFNPGTSAAMSYPGTTVYGAH